MKIYEFKGEMAVPEGFLFEPFIEWFRKEIKHGNVHLDYTSNTLFVEVESQDGLDKIKENANILNSNLST